MPWTSADATSHTKKADTPAKRKAWAKAANAALKQYDGDEQKAVATANATVDKMSNGKDDDRSVRTRAADNNRADDDDEDQEDDEKDDEDDDEDDEEDEEKDAEQAKKDKEKKEKRAFAKLDIMTRDASNGASVKLNSYDSKTRTADVMISTGARVRRNDWDGAYDEILDMSPASVRTDRLNHGAQFIDAHQYYRGLDAVLGAVVPGSARIVEGKLSAKIKLSRSDKGNRIAQDLSDGLTVPVSVGYRTHREVKDTTTSPETRVAVDWEPYEVSYAPIPHEAGAAFRAADIPHGRSPQDGVNAMNDKTGAGASGAQPTAEETARAEAARKRAVEEEATRKQAAEEEAAKKRAEDESAKQKQATDYALEMMAVGRQAGIEVAEVEKAIRASDTVDTFRKRALEHLAAESAKRMTNGSNGNGQGSHGGGDPMATRLDSYGRVVVGYDEQNQRAEAMSEALAIRILASRRIPGVKTNAQREWCRAMGRVDLVDRSMRIIDGHEQPAIPRTREFMGAGFLEMACICLDYRGHVRTPRHAEELIQRAFQSTTDYPAIFMNALNKALLARYQLAMPTYRAVGIERTFNDFRPHPQIRAGEFPQPQPLSETGELRAGASADLSETASVLPYGVVFPISRQMIVNDDLGAIDQLLGSTGDAVLVFENVTFWNMFNSNAGAGPVLNQDNFNVFDATNHHNVSAAGNEPTIGPVGAGRASMRVQKSLSGNILNTAARVLLSGAAHETRVDQMTAGAFQPTFTGAINPFHGKLEGVCEPLIPGNEWFLIADPAAVPCFVYGFLSGGYGPRMRTDEPFGYQGIRVSLEMDFGVAAIDYRGVYKDTGAPPTDIAYTSHTV
jgi:hypothetical protein